MVWIDVILLSLLLTLNTFTTAFITLIFNFYIYVLTLQKPPPEVFYEKGAFKNFAKFTGKHLCQSFSFN